MIVPMKKVSLMILGSRKNEALKTLRKLGLMQIEITEGSGQQLLALKEQIALLENAVFTVGKAKVTTAKTATTDEALAVAKEITGLAEAQKTYQAQKLTLQAELERLKGWGELDPLELRALTDRGVAVALYEMPKKEYDALGEELKTLCLEKTKNSVKFLLVRTGTEAEAELLSALHSYLFPLPQCSTQELRQKIALLEKQSSEIDEKLLSYGDYLPCMKAAIAACEKELEFEVYASGMSDECLSDDGAAVSVAYFTGYIEAENLDALKQAARENAWGLTAEDPTEEDDVPTQLKNNKFVSLIYPLTDFLNTVPGYFEYDISAWFLMFILIFFGMIFGDGAYGLLIAAIAAIPTVQALVKKKPVQPAFLLIGLLGLSTALWGMLTCTWCGLPAQDLPLWLQKLSVPVISNVYADKLWTLPWTPEGVGLTTAQNLQIFCFSLALIQLTVAHIKEALRHKSTLKILSDIGSIMQLVGMFYVVLSLVVNPLVFPLDLVIGGVPVATVAIVLVAVGFALSFVFANYEGSIAKSVLESLVNIVSVLLGVVNVFSDIVSYIRLWAVGLAGAAIATTVNELAGPLFGNFLFMILAIFLLVFGHGLNMILNVLSVVVHGIRLNTLEFSSHLGMTWSGHKFKPFKE